MICHGKVVFDTLMFWFLMVASKMIQNYSLITSSYNKDLIRIWMLPKRLSMVPLGCNQRPQRRGDRRTGKTMKNDGWQNDSYFLLHNSMNSGDSVFFINIFKMTFGITFCLRFLGFAKSWPNGWVPIFFSALSNWFLSIQWAMEISKSDFAGEVVKASSLSWSGFWELHRDCFRVDLT